MFSSEAVTSDYLHVNSCGIQYLGTRDTTMLRKDGRKDYHILYIHSGRCFTEMNGKEVIISAGGLILFKPGAKQQYAFKKQDQSVSCYLHFTGTGCEELLDGIGFENTSYFHLGKSHTVKMIFEKLVREYTLKKVGYENFCTAYLLELFAFIGRKKYYATQSAVCSKQTVIDKVCLHMSEHFAENLPIVYYATYANLSLSRFSHVFKSVTGVAPLAYLLELKINRAKDLLLTTDFSLSEISDIVGFSDTNYFCRIFKKHTGYSPGNFAKQSM